MEPIQEEDPSSILPPSECVRLFFVGIAIIAVSTALTWALWQLHVRTDGDVVTFFLWPVGLAVGLVVTVLGIVFGMLHSHNWAHRIMLLAVFAVVIIAVLGVSLSFYMDYPGSSAFFQRIAGWFS